MPGLYCFKSWLCAAFAINIGLAVLNGVLAFAGVAFFPIRYAVDTASIALLAASIVGTVIAWRMSRWSGITLATTAALLLVMQLVATTEIFWPAGSPEQQAVSRLGRYVLQPLADIVLTVGAYTLLYFYVVAWEKLAEASRRESSEQTLHQAQQQLAEHVAARTAELAAANDRLRQEIAERVRVEDDLRLKQRSLEGLVAAHDRDRQQVVYQIHDGLMQNLTGATLHIESVGSRQPDMTEEAREQCNRAFQLLRESMHVARGLLSDVRPPILDEKGLVAGLEYLVAEHRKQYGPPVELTHSVQSARISPVVEGVVYRIAQEALLNVRRHSRARHAWMHLHDVGERLHLEVRDDGVGFDPAFVSAGAQQLGIRSMTARAQGLLGTLRVESAPGTGSRILLEVPAVDSLEREIEQRLSAERALAVSERMYRLLADHSTDVISRHAPDGSTLYISPACRTLFGYEPEEVIAQSPYDLIHPEDREKILEYVINAATSGDFFAFTYRTLAKAGHYRWVETVGRRVADPQTGETLEFVTNSRDITDRRAAEEALKSSEERFRTVIKALPVGLYVTEGAAGHLVYANPAAMAIWEAREEDFHPYIWHQGVHPEDRPWILAEVQRAVAAGQPYRGEFRSLTPSGQEKWVRVVASFVVDEAGGRARRVGMIEDVTERRLADERRRQAETRHAQLVNAIPDMVFHIHRDGTYIDFEPGKGIEPLVPYEEFRGRRVAEILPEHVAKLCQAAIERALQAGRTQTIEYDIEKGNQIRRIEARVSPAGPDAVYVFVRDQTDRAARERGLPKGLDILRDPSGAASSPAESPGM